MPENNQPDTDSAYTFRLNFFGIMLLVPEGDDPERPDRFWVLVPNAVKPENFPICDGVTPHVNKLIFSKPHWNIGPLGQNADPKLEDQHNIQAKHGLPEARYLRDLQNLHVEIEATSAPDVESGLRIERHGATSSIFPNVGELQNFGWTLDLTELLRLRGFTQRHDLDRKFIARRYPSRKQRIDPAFRPLAARIVVDQGRIFTSKLADEGAGQNAIINLVLKDEVRECLIAQVVTLERRVVGPVRLRFRPLDAPRRTAGVLELEPKSGEDLDIWLENEATKGNTGPSDFRFLYNLLSGAKQLAAHQNMLPSPTKDDGSGSDDGQCSPATSQLQPS